MSVSLKGRSLLTLMDFTPDEIRYLLDLSHMLKAKKKAGKREKLLDGKNIVLLFEKTSTRTRCAFEVAAADEGAYVTFLDPKSSQMGKKESIEDSAKVLGRFFDGIEYRGYDQKTVESLARFSGVPVYNGLTDTDHPTQALADIMTIEENIKKPLNSCKLVFCGDTRNNVAYCLMYICAKLGLHFVGCGPKELAPDEAVMKNCLEVAANTGAVIEICDKPFEAVRGADAIYTDIWASMGEEHLIPERVKLLTPYKITKELFAATGNPDCIFLHCLPSFHDFNTEMAAEQLKLGYDIREVDDEVFSSPNSKVFDEAENRLHTIKAVLVATLSDNLNTEKDL
ncbi:MAG: ornithine carbamoyltransferase [Papillibacter sp.]|jgi:ornithine carbamoyltransferase|nr:ornithine carbamoyltransferase [Papillibacter sp.]